MFPTVLAAFLALGIPQTQEPRPPRPTDAQMLAAVQTERPDARILSHAFKEPPRGGGRVGCGLISVAGTVEPFSVFAAWSDRGRAVIRVEGAPPPEPEAPHWMVRVNAASHADHNGDGEIDRHDRNRDVLERMGTRIWCRELQPPEGVVWAMELEPDPDPARAARTQRQTDRAMGLIFGPREARRPDRTPD